MNLCTNKLYKYINKERVYEFFGLRKSWYCGVKGYLFATQEVGRKMVFL